MTYYWVILLIILTDGYVSFSFSFQHSGKDDGLNVKVKLVSRSTENQKINPTFPVKGILIFNYHNYPVIFDNIWIIIFKTRIYHLIG